MSVFVVPPLEEEPWPTLGPDVCQWMEENLIFGPGDLRGTPYVLNLEQRGLLYRMYEVFPPGHPRAGKRRFSRCAVSLRKGSAKSEFAAAVAAAELHREAPVRCVGFHRRRGELVPEGDGVRDPYIPMVAYTEEQSEDLAYYALFVMISESGLRRDFDIGLERIMRLHGDGVAKAMASAPDARDGARTTFQAFDETHRFELPRLKQAHRTMLANLPKRPLADPWALEITTAFAPGLGSVAEETMEYARSIAERRAQDAKLFFFHREADPKFDITTDEGLRGAIIDASGPIAEWSDIDAIAAQFADPTADLAYLERVWLNRPLRGSERAFDGAKFKALGQPGYRIADGASVVLGFDGSRSNDATGIVATELRTGHQAVVGLWENREGVPGWEVPARDVDRAMTEAFERWEVERAYCDPYWWESYVAQWAGRFGEKVVVEFRTNRLKLIAYALKAYALAIEQGELSHDGSEPFVRHISNACRSLTNYHDDDGNRMWTIQKERPGSPFKIDLAMAGCLSWQARLDAIASGALEERDPQFYV